MGLNGTHSEPTISNETSSKTEGHSNAGQDVGPPPNMLDVSVGDELEASPWAMIESDPGVFTELAAKIGIKGVVVEEMFGLGEECFEPLKPIYGLIFLFRWRDADTNESDVRGDIANDLFFMNQVVENACATQALVSIALNCDFLDIGEELSRFKTFTQDFTPAMRGLALTNSHLLRTAHNSFSRQTDLPVLDYPIPEIHKNPGSRKRKLSETDEDAPFHFISYVPVNGIVWELDGLKRAPKKLGEVPDGCNWIDVVQPAIRKRMERYENDAVEFSLMAVIKDRIETLRELQEDCARSLSAVRERLSHEESGLGIHPDTASSHLNELRDTMTKLESQQRATQRDLEDEIAKREKYHAENVRRRFNYGPFIRKYIEIVHRSGFLEDLLIA
ncbi:uncharacterized protein SPPG_02018 [Spizellomyces punctatus DAOM BR117]|uniref:Ubiquitin carboxyl-terminal hydrolase n=1 Tax=Spizellomyces punctatus (strain DAOM BR117) TaxID=645134 RepID=A0A0L0HQ53_SPIPD|nr:uncharacterized protein SPPG_02018 [Spizellomyces punctatus DAOM BR117]KND02939.1 hypothetical protein SPPG_02018 [Spizellomyces punctatus DAOM BR117]|eukprot:XP_016610978.1 hypothetical protein SPPG_02018 [Spizellomyces punctatus DAOM BR117]